ncbi:hypothetical protein [Pseudolysinimonas kribbensis]|nr:hypothetical protein [Pseudolysinimonas kribbensis]
MAANHDDDPDALIEQSTRRAPDVEPPPMARPIVSPPYGVPIPFGAPPAEPIQLAPDEIPWELREDEA